jgi:hypothetical protein
MTDKNVLWIRILIAIATFVALTGTIISYWHKRFGPEYFYPGPIYTVLYILAFFALANGVSYLSEILRKDGINLKIVTGVLSVMIFMFILMPLDQDVSPIIGWAVFIGLSISSILISFFSVLEWAQIKKSFRWFFPFLFAINSGIYNFFVSSMIIRNYKSFEAGIVIIGYSAVLFLICIVVNLIAVSSLKKINWDNQ